MELFNDTTLKPWLNLDVVFLGEQDERLVDGVDGRRRRRRVRVSGDDFMNSFRL
jgi:hypothetical protein